MCNYTFMVSRQDDDKVEEDPSVEVDEEPESQSVQEEVEEGDKVCLPSCLYILSNLNHPVNDYKLIMFIKVI